MPEVSYPAATYNSGAVTDAEYQRLPHGPDGLVGQPSELAAAEAVYANSSGREVHIRAGRYGSVLGRAWASGATDLTLPIGANASGSTRIDTVVLRLDRSTWLVRSAVHPGTPGSGPPALTRDTGDTGLWEIPLADVTVANGVSVITGAEVKMRALYQAGTIRPVKAIGDVQTLLAPGDIAYQGGTWYGWTGTAAVPITEDSGWVPLSLTGPTAGADAGAWAPNVVNQIRKRGGVVNLRISIKRTAGQLPTSDDGSAVFVLPDQFRPPQTIPVGGWQSRSPVIAQVNASGEVRIFAITDAIPSGRTVAGAGCWIRD